VTSTVVIPGRDEVASPQSLRFYDVQLHIVVRCFRIAPE
jgi:hypothetical protein